MLFLNWDAITMHSWMLSMNVWNVATSKEFKYSLIDEKTLTH
jgi:hypothetical protein